MADLAFAFFVAKWPHIPPNGLLFGCIVIMVLGLGVAYRWPEKKPPNPPKD